MAASLFLLKNHVCEKISILNSLISIIFCTFASLKKQNLITMKKLFTLILCALSLAANAQSIDYTKDGRHYYIASPNGRYFTGTVEEGPGCLFDAETKQHFATDVDSILIYAINNDGIACGARMGQAGVWVRGGEWKMLTALETISNQPITGGEICGMSADATKFIALMYYGEGKRIPVYYELDKFENWDNKDAWKFSTLPTPGKEDLLYNMAAQFVQVCGMNYDGTRILGRYMLADGKRQVPFLWQKNEAGEWTLNFVAERCLFVDEVSTGDITIPDREDFDNVIDYDIFRQSVEKGIIYDLSPYSLFAWTGSGRYIPLSANVADDQNPMGEYYAAVIDVDRDTLIILTAVRGAGSVSVNDKGEVFVYTPQLNTFRDSYVVSIDKPTEAISLIDYTLQRTNGAIDLAEYMTYRRGGTDTNPEMVAAAGSAIWANEGDGFVTFNYDEWNETKLPHCYMVRFGAPVAIDKVDVEQLSVYPNPTNGTIYFENQLTDVAIYDIAGSLVYSQSVAEQSINLSSLTAGTYILTAKSEGAIIITKVMLTR